MHLKKLNHIISLIHIMTLFVATDIVGFLFAYFFCFFLIAQEMSQKMNQVSKLSSNQDIHMNSIPKSVLLPAKSLPEKMNCLCSPTTHYGSFRCRQHRNSGLTSQSKSMGSSSSNLDDKSSSTDNMKIAQYN